MIVRNIYPQVHEETSHYLGYVSITGHGGMKPAKYFYCVLCIAPTSAFTRRTP